MATKKITNARQTKIDSYNIKNEILSDRYKKVSRYNFYRFIFPKGSFCREGHPEDKKPNGIMMALKEKPHGDKLKLNMGYLIFDELTGLKEADKQPLVVMSCIGYSGKKRKKNNAYTLYGLTFDIDDIGEAEMHSLLWHIDNGKIPTPTFLVNSGGGIHFYLIFDKPIPLLTRLRDPLEDLKRELTEIICNDDITLKEQGYQGLYQGYRVPGSLTKLGKGYPVVAYRTGEKVSLKDLAYYAVNEKVTDAINNLELDIDDAKRVAPENFKPYRGCGGNGGKLSPNVYYWWLSVILQEAQKGHRYWFIACLFVYAVKCNISKEQAMEDAMNAVKELNARFPDDPFTEKDVKKAATFYNEESIFMKSGTIETYTGITNTRKKTRNFGKTHRYRSKEKATACGHKYSSIEEATNARDRKEEYKDGKWRNKGRKKGASKQRDMIVQWREMNPEGTKKECEDELGINIKTVRRWWDALSSFDEWAIEKIEAEGKAVGNGINSAVGKMIAQSGLSNIRLIDEDYVYTVEEIKRMVESDDDYIALRVKK